MNTRIAAFTTLVMVLLVGCADQSHMTGPITNQGPSTSWLQKAKSEFLINTEVIGASGIKYSIEGSVSYSYLVQKDNETAIFSTSVNLGVGEDGTRILKEVRGGQYLETVLNPGGPTLVSDMISIDGHAETCAGTRIIRIQYELNEEGVKFVDVNVLDGETN